MKTYNQLITELNKFEKMMIQKGLKQIKSYPVSKRVVKGFKDKWSTKSETRNLCCILY